MYKIKRKPFLITKSIDGSNVIFDTRINKKVYKLNETAEFLWDNCQNEVDFDDLTELFCKNFDVELNQASLDIKEFIDELIKINLLERT